ncbi:MAG: Galactokinase [Fimbriimonadaceae bacterium]|nr:Galactokinase [Fimbriimonadaceae bacterium]
MRYPLPMLQERAARLFAERFGRAPEGVAYAPGRVNLIGEHTDYNEGFVLPTAIDRGIAVAFSRSEGPSVFVSSRYGEAEPFYAREAERGARGWARYAAGMAWALHQEFDAPIADVLAFTDADLPAGSGLSSSAALEVAVGLALCRASELEIAPKKLALLAHQAESEFVGVRCGVMDMFAIALSQKGSALFLDTRSLEFEHVPLPQGVSIAILDTGVRRELAGSAYNQRREECAQAAAAIGVESLRDADEGMLGSGPPLSDLLLRRVRHVIRENRRCEDFAAALRAHSTEPLGRLLRESHASLRDDFEVSSPELDAMVECAVGASGCLGARMTGAGFGGSCLALVESERAGGFLEEVRAAYFQRTGIEGEIWVCQSGTSATVT